MVDQNINFILAYLLGSIPTGVILSKIFAGSDIRNHGSGNMGATNMLRVFGKKLAIITLILDMFKGVVAILLCKSLFKIHAEKIILLTALLAVIGHMFPIWLKFKGGKGVATGGAVLLLINPLIGSLVIATWLVVFMITKVSSLAAIVASVLSPVFTIFFDTNMNLTLFCFVLSTLIIIKHKDNLKRLLSGKEKTFK